MNDKTAPLFRKAGRGYNKDDVNEYILSLSRRLSEAQSARDTDAAALAEARVRCNEYAAASAAQGAELAKLRADTAALSEKCRALEAGLGSLKSENMRLEDDLASARAEADRISSAYSGMCSKAGEILAMAGSAADDILHRAGDRAHEIINDADTKKNDMFRSISATADGFTSDIERYIKSATDDCMKKINDTIASVGNSGLEKTPAQNDGGCDGSVKFVDGDRF